MKGVKGDENAMCERMGVCFKEDGYKIGIHTCEIK